MKPLYLNLLISISMASTQHSCNTNSPNNENNTKASALAVPKSIDTLNPTLIDSHLINIESPYKFSTFKVEVNKSKLSRLNFVGDEFANDTDYRNFITNGFKEQGINFAGHYTIITKSCGTQCSHIFVVDRNSGKVMNDTIFNEGRDGFAFRKDSKLLIANSNLFVDSTFQTYNRNENQPEYYLMQNGRFVLLD